MLAASCLQESLYVAPDYATLGIADKFNDFITLFGGRKLCLDTVDSIADVKTRKIEISVDLLNVSDLVVSEVAATQTYGVDTGVSDGVSACLYIRGDILVDARATLNHNMGAEMGELMNKGSAADYSEVVDLHLAGQLRGVGDNNVITHNTVVGHV